MQLSTVLDISLLIYDGQSMLLFELLRLLTAGELNQDYQRCEAEVSNLRKGIVDIKNIIKIMYMNQAYSMCACVRSDPIRVS